MTECPHTYLLVFSLSLVFRRIGTSLAGFLPLSCSVIDHPKHDRPLTSRLHAKRSREDMTVDNPHTATLHISRERVQRLSSAVYSAQSAWRRGTSLLV